MYKFKNKPRPYKSGLSKNNFFCDFKNQTNLLQYNILYKVKFGSEIQVIGYSSKFRKQLFVCPVSFQYSSSHHTDALTIEFLFVVKYPK